MSTHIHLVAIPDGKDSVWRSLHRCHGAYATQFNMKHGFSGHLWQARPFSCALDQAHLWAAIRYVERNPVRAGLVDCAVDYPWSSAAAHCGLCQDPLLDSEWIARSEIRDWREWLGAENEDGVNQRLRDKTFTGRPCGDDMFVQEAEKPLRRHLAPQRPGPKPKQSAFQAQSKFWPGEEKQS
jgi:putative transposase